MVQPSTLPVNSALPPAALVLPSRFNRFLAWLVALDGWMVFRARLLVDLLIVAVVFIIPNNTFGLPTWQHLGRVATEQQWGWGIFVLALIALASRWAGPAARIIGAYLIAAVFITLAGLGFAATPQALVPVLLAGGAFWAVVSGIRSIVNNALRMPPK